MVNCKYIVNVLHADGHVVTANEVLHRTNRLDDARQSATDRVRRVAKRIGGTLKGDRQIAIVYKMLTSDQKPGKIDKQFIDGLMGEHPYYRPIESYEAVNTPDGLKIVEFKIGNKTPIWHKC